MKANKTPSAADLIFAIVAPVTALLGSVRITQSDGDLAAHIRMGEVILGSGRIPSHSLVSFTAPQDPLVAHAWLSEVLFALLNRLGGLPLLAVVTGIVVGLTHASIALFLRRRGLDSRWAFAAALLSLALAATHWLARPHMFSIVGAALTLFLLESNRPRKPLVFAVLFMLWTNLHGGWLYGLMMIAAYILGDLLEAALASSDRDAWKARARTDSISFVAATLATIVNPYGLGLHREVFSAITSSSLAKNIGEYLAPDFQEWVQLPFMVAILLTVVLLALATRRIRLPWLMLIVLSLFFALRSYRNIALFGVTAWPLIALHVGAAMPKWSKPFPLFTEFARIDPTSRVGILMAPVSILLLVVGLSRGTVGGTELIADDFSARKFPTAAVERLRGAGIGGRIFESWRWGGYIMYAWPDASLIVDPLKFNDSTLKSYSIIEDLDPGWEAELKRWRIETILIEPHSRMARGLALEPEWKVWYRDSTAVVFRPTNSPGT